jgi:hypothetical protein
VVSIRIKQIKTDLFGVVDAADPEVFRGVFSAPDHPVRILNIDERVLDQVANGLGIQLKRLGEDLFDYVTGDYHSKADGPTGTQLGNVTEALSYLLLRSGTTGVTRSTQGTHTRTSTMSRRAQIISPANSTRPWTEQSAWRDVLLFDWVRRFLM